MRMDKKLSLVEATALGVGIIIGASIFSLVGVGVKIAGSDLPEAFALSAIIALSVAYSYAKLGRILVSNAGPIEYVLHAFGDNVFVGALAFIYWFSFVISISLFTFTFTGYLLGALGLQNNTALYYTIEALLIAAFVALNFKGAKAVGDAETFLVAFKIFVLLVFIVGGIMLIHPDWLKPDWSLNGIKGLLVAAAMYLLSYAGFGVITNASEDIENPEKNVPRAIYLSLLISAIIYILVSIVIIGAVPRELVIKAEEYALAEAAKPILGEAGFLLVTIGALVSTASALNSALYGGANVAYALAKKGQLPKSFERRIWFGEPEGLYITAALALFLAIFLNLSGIAEVTTLSFLLIYLAVALSHWKLRQKTKGNPKVIVTSIILLIFSSIIILFYSFTTNPRAFWTSLIFISGSLVFEAAYRSITKREMKKRAKIKVQESQSGA